MRIDLNEKDKAIIDQARKTQTAYGKVFAGANGEGVIADLKKRFETGLPCFQGKRGEFDPLDAMRRDAYREVILYIEEKITLAEQNKD